MTWQASVLIAAALGTMMSTSQGRPGATAPSSVEPMRAEVVRFYPHDRAAFTQGLVLDGGRLYESTGLVGQSSLREVELESGRVIRRIDVAPPIFAEGLALVDDRLIQLTWRNERALLYDRRTFAKLGEVAYRGEGWGLCRDGATLIMSDGSPTLTVRRPKDFSVVRSIAVTMDGQPLDRLNELECVDGAVYANVWTRDVIVRIDLASGRVTHRVDAVNLLSPLERQNPDQVLNGIAYDPSDKTFLVTGKLWPKLFRLRFVAAGASRQRPGAGRPAR